MTGLVTIGESMMALTAEQIAPFRHVRTMTVSMAGAESTVAIGVRRLGHPATWISRLGDDEPGALIRTRLQGERVQVRAEVGPGPTGLMLKELPRAGTRRVHYYRHGSAASALSLADIPTDIVSAASALHLTGITVALGPGPAGAIRAATAAAAAAGTPVTLDVNYRSQLWTEGEARAALRPLLPDLDVLFASLNEAQILLGSTSSDGVQLAEELLNIGPETVVITLGAGGSIVTTRLATTNVPAVPAIEADPFGAGDSFVAGFLSARMEGGDPVEAALRGATVAAISVAVAGDWEGLPERSDLGNGVADIQR